jgi:hypothetical protein
MESKMKTITRRQLLGATASAIVAAPLLNLVSRSADAADAPRVDPEDPQAKALSYVHQSPKAENVCANCQLYNGSADADWGPCAIFPGKQVASAGWCSAWVKRAG